MTEQARWQPDDDTEAYTLQGPAGLIEVRTNTPGEWLMGRGVPVENYDRTQSYVEIPTND